MKIDVWNGSVSFDAGSIHRGFDVAAFLETPIGASSKKALANAGWVHFEFAPEAGILGTALFKDDRIHQLFVVMSMPSDQSEEWNEQQELHRKGLHDKWLLAELGPPPYQYAWGGISSDYDPKGRISEIIVTYGN